MIMEEHSAKEKIWGVKGYPKYQIVDVLTTVHKKADKPQWFRADPPVVYRYGFESRDTFDLFVELKRQLQMYCEYVDKTANVKANTRLRELANPYIDKFITIQDGARVGKGFVLRVVDFRIKYYEPMLSIGTPVLGLNNISNDKGNFLYTLALQQNLDSRDYYPAAVVYIFAFSLKDNRYEEYRAMLAKCYNRDHMPQDILMRNADRIERFENYFNTKEKQYGG